jgi:hypothetical protein
MPNKVGARAVVAVQPVTPLPPDAGDCGSFEYVQYDEVNNKYRCSPIKIDIADCNASDEALQYAGGTWTCIKGLVNAPRLDCRNGKAKGLKWDGSLNGGAGGYQCIDIPEPPSVSCATTREGDTVAGGNNSVAQYLIYNARTKTYSCRKLPMKICPAGESWVSNGSGGNYCKKVGSLFCPPPGRDRTDPRYRVASDENGNLTCQFLGNNSGFFTTRYWSSSSLRQPKNLGKHMFCSLGAMSGDHHCDDGFYVKCDVYPENGVWKLNVAQSCMNNVDCIANCIDTSASFAEVCEGGSYVSSCTLVDIQKPEFEGIARTQLDNYVRMNSNNPITGAPSCGSGCGSNPSTFTQPWGALTRGGYQSNVGTASCVRVTCQ